MGPKYWAFAEALAYDRLTGEKPAELYASGGWRSSIIHRSSSEP